MAGDSEASRQSYGIAPPVNTPASRNSLAAQADLPDGVLREDLTIAQSLLAGNAPRVPSRRHSLYQLPPLTFGADPILPVSSIMDPVVRRGGRNSTSNTWDSSNGEISETDDIDDRALFVQEYNKVAAQYGFPQLTPDTCDSHDSAMSLGRQGGWLMKRLLKRTSSMLASSNPKANFKHKRNVSDFSLRMLRRDGLKDKGLAELVRLCGSSLFYLPTEYGTGALNLPTCFRATAQYLLQRGPTVRGIFRVSGSHSAITALYNYYACREEEEDGDDISGTVRCPTLPDSIPCDEHDVASVFKKLLSGLPGGIIGNIWLFEALVSIQFQLGIDPELMKTKQSKIRARLIACAISSHPSRFQRDLICAVFGLLCVIGRASETALREDNNGRPLPTHGMMGYSSLGTIFGPLLLGDLIEEYDTDHGEFNLQKPESLQGNASPKRKQRHKRVKSVEESLAESKFASEKLKIANRVAEMLITHWRDVVRHMKSMGSQTAFVDQQHHTQGTATRKPRLRSSASESISLRQPPDWEQEDQTTRLIENDETPTYSCNPLKRGRIETRDVPLEKAPDDKHIKRFRPKHKKALSCDVPSEATPRISLALSKGGTDAQNEHLESEVNGAKARSSADYSLSSTSTFGDSIIHKKLRSNNKQSVDIIPPAEDGTTVLPSLALGNNGIQKEKKPEFNEKRTANKTLASIPYLGRIVPESKANHKYITVKGLEVESARAKKKADDSSAKLDSSEESQRVTAENTAETSSPAASFENGQESAPKPSTGHSPSETLEIMLSSNISKDAIVHKYLGDRATDPGQSRSRAHSPFKALKEYPWRRSHVTSHGSDSTHSNHSIDPLQRVSKEEDMASLASLAQAILSEDGGSNEAMTSSETGAQSGLPPSFYENIAMRGPVTPSRSLLENQRLKLSNSKTPTADAPKLRKLSRGPLTPDKSLRRRPMTDPAISRPITSTVKSLAQKFNEAEQGASLKATVLQPRKSTSERGRPTLRTQNSVISEYTSNPSPQSPSRSPNRPNRSLQSSCSRVFHHRDDVAPQSTPTKRSSLYRKSTSSLIQLSDSKPTSPSRAAKYCPVNEFRQNGDSELPQSPLRSLVRGPSIHNEGGDGNNSSESRRQPANGKVFPRDAEPPVARYLNGARSKTTSADDNSRSYDEVHGSAELKRQGRGTSLLYSQITSLQKLLEARAEEVENLKKQLAAQGKLNNAGTLSEQLREAKRNTDTWQKRALIAETRLERLPLAPMGKDVGKGNGVSSLEREDGGPESSNPAASVRDPALHGGVDCRTSEESAESGGTIKRRRIEPGQMSEEDQICLANGEGLLLNLAWERGLDAKASNGHGKELYEQA